VSLAKALQKAVTLIHERLELVCAMDFENKVFALIE
jgi:hypothetical protein